MPQFHKTERITSLKEIEHLFERGRSSSIQIMPLRAIYQLRSAEAEGKSEPAIKVLVSVAKKRLRHAVDRNRVKRQVREAFRLQHQPLSNTLLSLGKRMHIAFVWLSDTPAATNDVFEAMKKILDSIEEKYAPPKTGKRVIE
jgi:ribonuclease P protein component